MMLYLSIPIDEDVQQTLSFFEKVFVIIVSHFVFHSLLAFARGTILFSKMNVKCILD